MPRLFGLFGLFHFGKGTITLHVEPLKLLQAKYDQVGFFQGILLLEVEV